jgi:hypothetical protein
MLVVKDRVKPVAVAGVLVQRGLTGLVVRVAQVVMGLRTLTRDRLSLMPVAAVAAVVVLLVALAAVVLVVLVEMVMVLLEPQTQAAAVVVVLTTI